ncbi:MAG: GTPase HflX [Chlamydiae bacterium]|nr:MAG: GTPase HflX [Chlamydiota bacterium]
MDAQFPTFDECEKVFLVGFNSKENVVAGKNVSYDELKSLTVTAGAEPVDGCISNQKTVNPAFYIGKGKVAEIAETCKKNEFHAVIFDIDLSPAQTRNLEKAIEVKIIDRTTLILEIFAQHARTNEGKLQVELAQLEYLLPRLTNMWTHLSRQYGGLRTRGPGEKQLESDKRIIKSRIRRLNGLLSNIRKQRATQRKKRKKIHLPVIGIVGYTNAGKSTFLNSLTKADVLVEDKLFATLDPTTRLYQFSTGEKFLFVDTVGFIRNLPHKLVESFKATLEETMEADVLLHIADASAPDLESQISAVNSVLKEIGTKDKPVLLALNKVDVLSHKAKKDLLADNSKTVIISAKYNYGFAELFTKLRLLLKPDNKRIKLRLPPHKSELLSKLYKYGKVISVEYLDEYIKVDAFVPKNLTDQIQKFRVKKSN